MKDAVERKREWHEGTKRMRPLFETIVIQGVGLIGGSIGLALRRRGVAERVVGIGRDRERMESAKALGAIDAYTLDAEEGVRCASLVVVCSPVSMIGEHVKAAVDLSPKGTLVTDAGSTKHGIVEKLGCVAGLAEKYVPAHPIAGSERSGVEHADGNLFEGRVCVLTPLEATPEGTVEQVAEFWSSVGCEVARLSAREHDALLAWVSHGPHVMAATQARVVPRAAHRFGGGAFRDGTRVAASDAALWTAIFLENQDAVLAAVDAYLDDMGEFRRLLAAGDQDGLRDWWREGQRSRLAFETRSSLENQHHHGGDSL